MHRAHRRRVVPPLILWLLFDLALLAHRYRRRSRHRASPTQRLLADQEWTNYLKGMGAWRHDPEMIVI